MPILYTLGYGNRKPLDTFALVPKGAIIIDICRDPRGWSPSYHARQLKAHFGDRYKSIPALGNLSQSPNVWQPVDPVAARQHLQLIAHAVAVRPHVLLCAEKDAAGCHRRFVAEQIGELVPELEIEHL